MGPFFSSLAHLPTCTPQLCENKILEVASPEQINERAKERERERERKIERMGEEGETERKRERDRDR